MPLRLERAGSVADDFKEASAVAMKHQGTPAQAKTAEADPLKEVFEESVE